MNIAEEIAKLKWYHEIEVAPGLVTVPVQRFDVSWELIESHLPGLDLNKKTVLDVGTRDGKYAFMAEKMGATVLAIDNNQSPGALLLKEYWASKVEFAERNLYNLGPLPEPNEFDVIFFFGVLYHLRFPMLGLRSITK